MKDGGVINITLSDGKLVVELSGKKTKIIEESDLTPEQRTLKNYMQSSSGKKSISRSELENMVSGSYNEDKGKTNDKNGNGKIIASIAIVSGLVLIAVVIGVVVY